MKIIIEIYIFIPNVYLFSNRSVSIMYKLKSFWKKEKKKNFYRDGPNVRDGALAQYEARLNVSRLGQVW